MMTKETRTALKRNIAAVIEAHHETRRSGPNATVSVLVERIGHQAAAEAIAALVNTVGPWDLRVCDRSRSWAEDLAPDRDDLRDAYIFTPAEIHPAHIDQLAGAMARYAVSVEA